MFAVKIYHNDGFDRFNSFNPKTAELEMVYQFDIATLDNVRAADLLEYIFQEFNVGGTFLQQAKQYRAKYLRSLSVGDIVVVGETAFSCNNYGWSVIPTDELKNAIKERI